MCIYIYIYIHRERERDIDIHSDIERTRKKQVAVRHGNNCERLSRKESVFSLDPTPHGVNWL